MSFPGHSPEQYFKPAPPVDYDDETPTNHLARIDPRLRYEDALAGFITPPVFLTTEGQVAEYSLDDITHVCLKSYYIEQVLILYKAGVRWDWNYPFVVWHFLARIASKALFGREDELCWLSASVDGGREIVCFSRRAFVAAAPATRVSVVEVSLGWPRGAKVDVEVMQAFWKPGRPHIVSSISQRVRKDGNDAKITPIDPALTASGVQTGRPIGAASWDRILVVGENGMYYSVYCRAGEYRAIPLECFDDVGSDLRQPL